MQSVSAVHGRDGEDRVMPPVRPVAAPPSALVPAAQSTRGRGSQSPSISSAQAPPHPTLPSCEHVNVLYETLHSTPGGNPDKDDYEYRGLAPRWSPPCADHGGGAGSSSQARDTGMGAPPDLGPEPRASLLYEASSEFPAKDPIGPDTGGQNGAEGPRAKLQGSVPLALPLWGVS